MNPQKPSFLAVLCRRVGESIGLLEAAARADRDDTGHQAVARSEAHVRDALLAVEEMGRFQRALGRKGCKAWRDSPLDQ